MVYVRLLLHKMCSNHLDPYYVKVNFTEDTMENVKGLSSGMLMTVGRVRRRG